MIKLPAVVGLMVCRRFEVDTSTGYVNLIGICHELQYLRFPTLPEPFTLYVHLYGGAGEGTIELLILSLETEREIYRYRRWAAFERGQLYLSRAAVFQRQAAICWSCSLTASC